MSDEEADPLKHFTRLRSLSDRKWMAELFTAKGFCSYKTIKGPTYGARSRFASARIGCIGKEYAGTKIRKKNSLEIRLTKEDDYNKKALAACGCE